MIPRTDFRGGARRFGGRLAAFLGLRGPVVGMLAVVVLLGLGERLTERFQSVYLLALGAGAAVPGYVNGVNNLLGALYAFPGGWLASRLGHRRALLAFNLVALTGYLLAAMAPNWWLVVVGVLLFQAWGTISMPATMELIATALPARKRTMGVTMHSLVRRIPMALGPVLGGLLIARHGLEAGARWGFLGASVLAVAAIGVQWRWLPEGAPQPSAALGWRQIPALIPPPLRTLLVTDILVRFCEQLPYAYVVVWLMRHPDGARIGATQVGLLTAVEMGAAVLVYLPVAWLADRGAKKPFVVVTYAFFTAFPLLLLWSTSMPWLVLAFVVRGLKEFGEPTRKALILDLAPPDRRAAAFGSYYLVRDCVVGVVALSAGWWWQLGPAVNFGLAAGFGLTGTLLLAWLGRDPVPRAKELG